MKGKVLILCGGGLDSGVMATFAYCQARQAELLFFDYGQKARVGEMSACARLVKEFHFPLTEVRLPGLMIPASPLTEGAAVLDPTNQAANEVPGRNLLFLACAFSLAMRDPDITEIWIGSDRPVLGAGFGDQKQATFDGFNVTTAFAYGENSPRVVAPLLRYERKLEFLREGLMRFPALFDATFSCYESRTEVECGKCNHCIVKQGMRESLRKEDYCV